MQFFYQKGGSLGEDDVSWSSCTNNSPGKLFSSYETWQTIAPLEKSHRIIINCKNTVDIFFNWVFYLKKYKHVLKIIYECTHSIIHLFSTIMIFTISVLIFFQLYFFGFFFHFILLFLIDRNKICLRLSWKNW